MTLNRQQRKRLFQETIGEELGEKTHHKNLKVCAALAYERNQDNYDTITAISGDKGTGKSNLGIQLALEYIDICKQNGLHLKFDIEENVIYSSSQKEIMKKINEASQYDVLMFDEAARFILAEDWNKKQSKKLKQMWGEIRTKNLFIILVLPFKFNRVDKKYRESLVNFWIECPIRAYGILSEKTRNGFYADTMYKKIGWVKWSDGKLNRQYVKNKVNKAAKRSNPSYIGQVTWREIPKQYREYYYEHRDKNVYEKDDEEEKDDIIVDQENKNMKKLKKKVYGLLNVCLRTGLTQKEIAKQMQVSRSTVTKWKQRYKDVSVK